MTDVHAGLQAFWSQFSASGTAIPAYEQGKVPNGATLPYITYNVRRGDLLSATFETAFVWLKRTSGTDADAVRASVMDAIEQAIPTEGTIIHVAGGMLALYRNGADFLSYYDDPEDSTVIGGRVSYELHFYTI